MVEKTLGIACAAGLVGGLQSAAWPALSLGPARPTTLIVVALQLLVFGALTALLLAPQAGWPATLAAAALVGAAGQGIAWAYTGADPLLLAPAALAAACGAVLYKLLALPAAAHTTEDDDA